MITRRRTRRKRSGGGGATRHVHEDVQQPSRRALVPSLGLPLADLVCSVRPADMFAIGQERKQKEKDEVEDQSDDDDDDNAAAVAAAAAEEEEGDVFGKNW